MQLRGSHVRVRPHGRWAVAGRLLERVRALDRKLPGLDETAYGLAKNERFGDVIARSWNKLVGAWTTFNDELAKLPATDPATTTTRERFLLPLFEELGYGRPEPDEGGRHRQQGLPGQPCLRDRPGPPRGRQHPDRPSHKGRRRRRRPVAPRPRPRAAEPEHRAPVGIVTNGRTLRILRDNASLVRQAYVEFDLEAIMAGEAYADFALLWHLAHRTRLEPRVADAAEEGSSPTQAGCYLERWSKVAEETGARARDRLRDGVQEAIEALGSGFLAHPANRELKIALDSGGLTTQDYYRELLRLVYRFILLFVAEDRDLLLDPRPISRPRTATATTRPRGCVVWPSAARAPAMPTCTQGSGSSSPRSARTTAPRGLACRRSAASCSGARPALISIPPSSPTAISSTRSGSSPRSRRSRSSGPSTTATSAARSSARSTNRSSSSTP